MMTDKKSKKNSTDCEADVDDSLEFARLKDELEEKCGEAEQYLDHLRRLQAEFDNYRKRTMRELDRAMDLGKEQVIASVIPVIDAFELALSSGEDESKAFRDGIRMVHSEFLKTLRAEGLEEVKSLGAPFDPSVHEAVEAVEADGEEDGTIVGERRRGYSFKGRLLRPASVIVAVDKTKIESLEGTEFSESIGIRQSSGKEPGETSEEPGSDTDGEAGGEIAGDPEEMN
jgi:molecular chaperone GrpE